MHIITMEVHPNEPAYGAMQGPALLNGDFRWVERVFVVRGDAIAKWEKDWGPAENFKDCTQTRDLIDGDITVQEVQEMMAQDRQDHYWARQREALRGQSTLIADTMDQLEERRAIIHNRTVSGPAHTRQRNGFSQQTIQRAISEKRQARTGIVPRRSR